jgi:predicted DsbA family dithiol-disulfide isomerase
MQGLLNLPLLKSDDEQSAFERATWALREAFFVNRSDVSERHVQFEIAGKLGLPVDAIRSEIDSGAAYAELSKDFDLVKETAVTVSPTMVFNEGRQRLNGNVGYRVIEANIRELINNPPNEQSWC